MMTEYKCVVCKMPMLVLEDKIGNGDTPIGRCVHSNCVMSSIWLPIEALDEIERLQAERDQVCEWESVRHNPPGLPIYYVYYSPHNASLWITTNQIEYFTFCPNCGKRIEYVEES